MQRWKGVEIEIGGVSNNFFIDKNDVYAIVKRFGGDSTQKKSLASVDLRRIEEALKKDVWIKNAELFFDNNDMLKVLVEEREPIARIFSLTGNTFYTDSSCMVLPLSEKFSARVPVFTGFPSDAKILSKPDSLLLRDIKNISLKIAADSFLMAMIDQVDITPAKGFEMVPKIGKQQIIFGDATDADAKFANLKLFYKNVITKAGWNKYKTINLQYKDQVVAAIRGKEDVTADSLHTLELLKAIAADAAAKATDTAQGFIQAAERNVTDTLPQQSVERDEGPDNDAAPVQNAAAPAVSAQPANRDPKPAVVPKPAAVQKPARQTPKPATHDPKPKPKVKTAKPNNDY